jgi:hypothetical protein
MHRLVGTHIFDRTTGLTHVSVTYDEGDNATIARLAGDLGHRTLCGVLEGMWTPRTRPVTCVLCMVVWTDVDPRSAA